MKRADPDVRVIRVARLVELLVDGVHAFDGALFPRLGKWEADVEARNLLLLAACHAKSAATLAWSSASNFPSAASLARNSIDAGAAALWLLQPDDPFTRETRWLSHLDGEIRIRERLVKDFSGSEGAHGREEALAGFKAFRKRVADLLPAGYEVPSRFPDSRSILAEIGHPEKYTLYAILSQHVHATHYATGAFRKNLGTEKRFGEFISPGDWGLALSTAWWFVAKPLLMLAERYGLERSVAIAPSVEAEFADAQKALMS